MFSASQVESEDILCAYGPSLTPHFFHTLLLSPPTLYFTFPADPLIVLTLFSSHAPSTSPSFPSPSLPFLQNRSNLSVECIQVRTYSGHRDGVWQVSHARNGLPLIGLASAGVLVEWHNE